MGKRKKIKDKSQYSTNAVKDIELNGETTDEAKAEMPAEEETPAFEKKAKEELSVKERLKSGLESIIARGKNRVELTVGEKLVAEEEMVDKVIQMPEGVHYFSLYTLFSVLYKKWKVFVALMLAGAIAATVVIYIPTNFKASAVMSMNYEESAKGKNPNGTRFNLSEIRSEEVAKRALALAGLKGKVKPQVIIDGLSVTPYSSKSSSELYISSSYNLEFRKPFLKLREVSAEKMLEFVCKAYKEKFYDNYIVTANVLGGVKLDTDTMDYSDMNSYFTMMLDRADRYLNMRINQAGAFIDENGQTFKTLRKQVANLRDYDLKRFESYIWENGISNDKNYQIDKLMYINHNKMYDHEVALSGSQVRLNTIDEYEKSMTSSILIPSYDENYEFYMARTKTGIDDIAKEADSLLSKAKGYELEVSMNTDRIIKLWQPYEWNQYQTASAMAKDIESKIIELMDSISNLDNAFILQNTRNYITFETSKTAFLTGKNLKHILAVMGLIFVLTYTFFVNRKKNELKRSIKKLVADRKKKGGLAE